MTLLKRKDQVPVYLRRRFHMKILIWSFAVIIVGLTSDAWTSTGTRSDNGTFDSGAIGAPRSGVEGKVYLAQYEQYQKAFNDLVNEWCRLQNDRKLKEVRALFRNDAMTVIGADNKRVGMEEFEKYLYSSPRISRMPRLSVNNPKILNVEGDKAKIEFDYTVQGERTTVILELMKEPDGRWLIKDWSERK